MLRFKNTNRPRPWRTPPWLKYARPFRRYKDPEEEFVKELLAIDERRVKGFLDMVAELALADAEREAERKRKYTVRINVQPRLRIRCQSA